MVICRHREYRKIYKYIIIDLYKKCFTGGKKFPRVIPKTERYPPWLNRRNLMNKQVIISDWINNPNSLLSTDTGYRLRHVNGRMVKSDEHETFFVVEDDGRLYEDGHSYESQTGCIPAELVDVTEKLRKAWLEQQQRGDDYVNTYQERQNARLARYIARAEKARKEGAVAHKRAHELLDVIPLTENQKKAYRLADNRIPLNAGWDEELLSAELADLAADDFALDSIGFTQRELDNLLSAAVYDDTEGMDIPFEKDEAKSGVKVQYLSFGGHKIPATDEEADRFDCAVSRYVDDNGSYIGFVSALLAGEVC